MNTQSPLRKIKSIILYATIALLVAGAIVAIFMIFYGPSHIMFQCLATVAILYVMAILSVNNFSHTDSEYLSTQVCSGVALVTNLFWAIPWILLVWDVFGINSTLTEVVWRLMWTALIISLYFTMMSTQWPSLRNFQGLVRVKQAIPMFLITCLFFNAMMFIWTADWSGRYGVSLDFEFIFKLCCAEVIIIFLQWAIPEILIRSQKGQANNRPATNAPQAAPMIAAGNQSAHNPNNQPAHNMPKNNSANDQQGEWDDEPVMPEPHHKPAERSENAHKSHHGNPAKDAAPEVEEIK